MSHSFPLYPHLARSHSHHSRTLTPEDSPNSNTDKALQQVRYHQPFQRLQRRLKFRKVWKQIFPQHQNSQFLKYDNFALVDVIAKRGGFNQICHQNRWEEVGLCLCLDKKHWNFTQYYHDIILPQEGRLLEQLDWYPLDQIYDRQTLELHLLPNNNLTSTYYHITPSETVFMLNNFFSVDEYFNLKTVVMLQPDTTKIPLEYADKFMLLRKRLLFTNQIKELSSPRQLKSLCLIPNPENKVIIVGLSLPTLMMADKLSQLGMSVIIVDKYHKEMQYQEDNLIAENGLVLLQGGQNRGSYYSALTNIGVLMEELPHYCQWLDEDFKPAADEKVRVAEEHFLSIIYEFKEEAMNKKKFYEELMSRVLRRKLDYQKYLIKWHYDRYMLFNRIKGESTTVGDMVNYQSKKFVKYITQSHTVVGLKSWSKLLERVKARKNVAIVQGTIQGVTFEGGTWNTKMKEGSATGKYFIYADHQSIYKSVLEGNPRIPDLGSDILGQSATLLHQLSSLKYVNCLYTFKDRISFRQNVQGLSSFTINSVHGFIYYFVLAGGNQILSTLRCYPNSNINYYQQLYLILDKHCLTKSNKLQSVENYSFEYTFSIKDEKHLESLIRIKQVEKMFLMLPMTTVNSPHRLQSQIDMSNYICTLILEDSYSDYSKYDETSRGMFKQEGGITRDCIFMGPKEGSQAIKASVHKDTKVTLINKVEGEVVIEVPEKRGYLMLESWLLGQDAFGLSSGVVRNYELYVKSKLDGDQRDGDICASLWQFQIDQQILIDCHLYIYSLGQPYSRSKVWFSCILPQKVERQEWMLILNKIVTRRQHIALSQPLRATVYYQTLLVVDDQLYYCLIDESQPQLLYYHTDIAVLVERVNQKMEIITKGIGQRERVRRGFMGSHPPNSITSTNIIAKIKEQRYKGSQEVDLDILLEQKLNNVNHYYPKEMASLPQNIESPSDVDKTRIQLQLQDVDLNVSLILRQVQSYSRVLFRMSEFKCFTLFDSFFGAMNEQYICCEIMRIFQKKPLDLISIEKADKFLHAEIKAVFARNAPNQLYGILIQPQGSRVTIHRNFVHRENLNSFQKYSYLCEMIDNTVNHYLISSHTKLRVTDRGQIMVQILRGLVGQHHNSSIVRHLQLMIHRDIQKTRDMSPLIKSYFQMTKMEKQRSGETKKFRQRCKDLNLKQREKVVQLIREKKVYWVDNDFIFAVK